MFNECYFQARWHCACDWDVLHSCCYCRCCGFEGKVHKKWNSHETTRKNSNPQIYYIIHRSNPISLDKAPYLTESEQLFGPRRLKLRWRVRRRICQNQLIQGWSASSRWTSSTQSPWTSPPSPRCPRGSVLLTQLIILWLHSNAFVVTRIHALFHNFHLFVLIVLMSMKNILIKDWHPR